MFYGDTLDSTKKINNKIHNFDDKLFGATLEITFTLVLINYNASSSTHQAFPNVGDPFFFFISNHISLIAQKGATHVHGTYTRDTPTSQENVKRSRNSNKLQHVKQELATTQSYSLQY